MQKKYVTILIVILLVAGGAYYINSSNNAASNVGTNIGERAPDFTLNKVNGDEVKLSSLRGKKVFINFWASWCPPCREEMPAIQKLYVEHEDIAILAVNLQEDKKTVIDFMMNNHYTFPVVLDKKSNVASKYLVRGIPTTYTLDENGVIIDKTSGALTYQQMLDMLEIK